MKIILSLVFITMLFVFIQSLHKHKKSRKSSQGVQLRRYVKIDNKYNSHIRRSHIHATNLASVSLDEARSMHEQFVQEEQNRHFMEESIKSVTPFDHGGNLLGEGINPSDTMAQDNMTFHDMGGMF